MSSERIENDGDTKPAGEDEVSVHTGAEETTEEVKTEDLGDTTSVSGETTKVETESSVELPQPLQEEPVEMPQNVSSLSVPEPQEESSMMVGEETTTEMETEVFDMPTDVEDALEAVEFPFQADEGAEFFQDTTHSKTSVKSRTTDRRISDSSSLIEDLDSLEELEKMRESMITHAGSYRSTSSGSQPVSEDENLPKNFQDYVKRYSSLFGQASSEEEKPCDDEADKAFLKIDLDEIVSGYKTESKLCRDTKSSLEGMTRVRQDLICVENESIVFRKDYKQYKGVRILSGGHMGSEPLYVDYVGKGLLTGVVLGTVSDPPAVASVIKAVRELSKGSTGVLIVIQNKAEYRLIFGLAMERIRMEGFSNIDMVTVGDDCYERCKTPVGRRGLSGIVLLYKIAGSMADCARTLHEVYVATRSASKSIATISCMTKPFKAIGTGLDKSSKEGIPFNGDNCQMIKKMIEYCISPTKYFSIRLEPEDTFIVLINSYRSKTPEFYMFVDCIMRELEKSVKCVRAYADNFVTGFWPGFSITLLLDCNSYRTHFMDSPCNCSLWPRTPSDGFARTVALTCHETTVFAEMGPMLPKTETRMVKHAVVTACKAILLCENLLNTIHFFGNYGTKLRVGAEAILNATRQSSLNFNRPFNLLIEISELLVEKLPGVMGAMYGCLFEGAARSFIRSPLTTITAENWSEAMDEALKTLRAYTNAKGGVVSLALSLIPVVSAIHGPYIRLPQKANRNPILSALDSLRSEIEERVKQASDEKESQLKNQLDVESYALVIWLHAIYSSVYWRDSSESSITTAESIDKTVSHKSSVSRSSKQSSKTKSSRLSSVKEINKSLEFISVASKERLRSSQVSERERKPSQLSEANRSAKIFT